MTFTLPNDVQVRPPTMADLQAVTNLIQTCDLADFGEADTVSDDILYDWERPEFDLATLAHVLVNADGELIGYTDVCPDRYGMMINANTAVHLSYRNQGLEEYLISWAETEGRHYIVEHPDTVTHLIHTISVTDTRSELLARLGYTFTERDWRMEIVMQEEPPTPVEPQLPRPPQGGPLHLFPSTPVEPEGITIRPFIVGQDEHDMHRIIQEAFRDHVGRVYDPFESWERWAFQSGGFDPQLSFMALEGKEVVGAILTRLQPEEGGVRQVGVLRPWRGRSIGMQLLLSAFNGFYRRDIRKVRLTVATDNTTGAIELYKKAGMHPVAHFDYYEKEVEG